MPPLHPQWGFDPEAGKTEGTKVICTGSAILTKGANVCAYTELFEFLTNLGIC